MWGREGINDVLNVCPTITIRILAVLVKIGHNFNRSFSSSTLYLIDLDIRCMEPPKKSFQPRLDHVGPHMILN